MTPTTLTLRFTATGHPAPKGSLRHVGHGRLVEQVKRSGGWRTIVATAAREAAREVGWGTLTGPVEVTVDVRVPHLKRPRLWPVTRSSGDLDKHLRNIFDALTDASVIGDDSQIVRVAAMKRYDVVPGVVVAVRAVEVEGVA